MRLSSIEEYGLRCLLQVARHPGDEPLRIPQIAEAEGLSPEYTAKILRILREGELVQSTRGASGGYRLARKPNEITVLQALSVLDGPLIHDDWCQKHRGRLDTCVHKTDCTISSLWGWMSQILQDAAAHITLDDLIRGSLHIKRVIDQKPCPSAALCCEAKQS